MSERMDDDALDRYYTDGADDIVYDEAKRARASEAAKDKEIERLKAELIAAEGMIVTLTEQLAQVRESTLQSFSARDAEAERLMADNAALIDALSEADHDDECQFLQMAARWSGVALGLPVGLPVPVSVCDCFKAVEHRPHPGTAILEELTRLRATIRDIGERLVAAGGTREGTILEQLNSILQRTDAKAP